MKEVIILGHGPSRGHCQYHCETWGVNNVYDFAKRLDRLFIMDKINEQEFEYGQLDRIAAEGTIITTSIPYPEYEGRWKIEPYPIRDVLTKFQTRFFSNAICYMMAFALLNDYEKIWWYGIDMSTSSTYLFEKGAVEYWMGRANERGVPVINTEESATGKTIDGRMYGYWGPEQDNTVNSSLAMAKEMERMVTNFYSHSANPADGGHELLKTRKILDRMGVQQF